jgi:E3 ubiquitin-protein ligase HUWE1
LTKSVPLKENGVTTAVTQENKREYVQLSAEYRLVKSIKAQIDALLGGFYEIIPKELIAIVRETLSGCNSFALTLPLS